jgi:hypothetical protein
MCSNGISLYVDVMFQFFESPVTLNPLTSYGVFVEPAASNASSIASELLNQSFGTVFGAVQVH